VVADEGIAPDGTPYQYRQAGDLRFNHVAYLPHNNPRAGNTRIGDAGLTKWGASPVNDHQPSKEKDMTLKTVTVDGIPVEVTDQGATVIATLQTRLADANKKFTDAETAHQTALAAKDADLAKKDAEIDSLKGKILSDADLDKRVQARADLIAVAKSIAKDVKTEGLTDAAIRKAVVAAKLGDAAIADKAEAYIDARFDILAEDAKKNASADPFARVVSDGLKPTGDAHTQANDAWNKSVADLNAWRKEA
jgi:hypothetical protein